ncbi:acetolactate synthase 3 large subunit [Psychrobium sp. 1_MG-2023]|uniref:acetolactate synthase 3 large subunit n=1 Tax=Psychrobium sp. 1_MG-2023 TaxID=3062624 RepID=UPI000C33CB9D|nr:acetolactate synthase 3 large subunit [Psychrobium sp. 1_MG-2023]MDP2562234.1 acetolactate synthase 3 large subunit [Psychrobium sp. 1_MG-2023]PKF57628.1 acetolactate synthase 3 large subunit [Alteromonadales bacterium alter-6D02]
MEMISGAEMVIRSLQDQGVERIYGYPGGSVLDLYDALFQQSSVEHILVRHEQAAVHMADGYARATGDVGTVLVTSGPGATNCITGIATAYMDSIPMVVLSGQVPTTMIGEDAFQETDMVGVSRPIVKHSFLCKRAEDIPETIKKAYYIASTGRPGPVVVDLPKDIINPQLRFPYSYPESVSLRSYNPTARGHKRQTRKALKVLLEAKRPVIYAGGGAIWENTPELLKEFAEIVGCPVTNTLMGLGVYPATDKQFVGMLGMHGTLEANKTMHHSDVIFAIGVRFDDRTTNNLEKYCPDATVIHIDIDPTSISKTVHADIPIVGYAHNVLQDMLDMIKHDELSSDSQAMAAWWDQIEQWRSVKCLSYETNPDSLKPQQVVEAMYKATNGDAYVCSDVGQHQMFAALYYPFDKPRRWINSGGLGTMGFGLPAAMGVQMAFPDSTVVCISGDGSIQMNIQELSTCLQYDLPIKVIILNNRSLGMVKQWQDMIYKGRHSHSYWDSVPDFVKLAEAFGHVGIKVDRPDELDDAFARCFAQKDRLVVMDIAVDEQEHVYPMLIKYGAMNEMYLSKTERS